MAISYWYSMITELPFSTWQENIYTILGKQGGGPDEFSRISGLEPHDHLIYIKDSPTRIKIYDWQGKFHQTIQIPDKNIRGFYPLPKTNVILGHVPNSLATHPFGSIFAKI
mgnify:CR=1 FL=1